MTHAETLADSHGRLPRDLRASLADRCNFRRLTAGNGSRPKFLSRPLGATAQLHVHHPARGSPVRLLSFKEIERAVRVAVSLGIRKIRLTGGEPSLRGVNRLRFPCPAPGLKHWSSRPHLA